VRVVLAVVELEERRARGRMAEQVLGREDDQRLAEGAVELAAERVEVVGRRRAVDDLPVGRLDLRVLVGGWGGW
jgi:hypothetical protein